jgi:hypothetical protein
LNKDDFLVWRNSEVTSEFKQSVVHELDNLISDLCNSAGDDPLVDKYRRGVIMGLQWLLDWNPDLDDVSIEQENDTDGTDSEGTQDSY